MMQISTPACLPVSRLLQEEYFTLYSPQVHCYCGCLRMATSLRVAGTLDAGSGGHELVFLFERSS